MRGIEPREGDCKPKQYMNTITCTDRLKLMSKHKNPKAVMRYNHGRENLDQNTVNLISYDDE